MIIEQNDEHGKYKKMRTTNPSGPTLDCYVHVHVGKGKKKNGKKKKGMGVLPNTVVKYRGRKGLSSSRGSRAVDAHLSPHSFESLEQLPPRTQSSNSLGLES